MRRIQKRSRIALPRVINVGDEKNGHDDFDEVVGSITSHSPGMQEDPSIHESSMHAMEDPKHPSGAPLTSVIPPYVYHL